MRAVLLALAWTATPAAAQGLRVEATLSDRRVSIDEQLVLSVSISGAGAVSAAPRLPLLPDFEVYESGRSQSYSIVNGRMSSSVVFAYVLAPRKPGRFRIPPIEVSGADPTPPMEVTVLLGPPGDAPGPAPAPTQPRAQQDAQRRPPVFITAALDKERALVNEQVTLTVRFYTAVPLLGSPQYEPPKLNGLLSEELGGEGHGQASFAGVPYQYSELKAALFPVQAGRTSVGSAAVTVQLPRSRAGPFGDDFFDRFFGMSSPETRRLQTDPLSLQVEALPETGRPEDFSGIVGQLALKASVDRSTVKAGEAVNWTVSVLGVGNIKSVPEPRKPELPSARFFDSETAFTPQRSQDRAGGTKTFRCVLVPRVSGPLEIPAPSLSYYDPQRRAYVRAQAEPTRLHVLPGDPNATLPLAGPGTGATPGVIAVSEDISYLKRPGGRSVLGDGLSAFGAAGPWHALPLALLALAGGRELRRRALESDPAARRFRQARAGAERRLKDAAALPDAERPKAAALLAEALTDYLADKLAAPTVGLTLRSALEQLRSRRRPPPPATLVRVKAVWEELDLLRFAPGAAGHAEVERLASEVRALLRALEEELPS